jgi:hypothetical protein
MTAQLFQAHVDRKIQSFLGTPLREDGFEDSLACNTKFSADINDMACRNPLAPSSAISGAPLKFRTVSLGSMVNCVPEQSASTGQGLRIAIGLFATRISPQQQQ